MSLHDKIMNIIGRHSSCRATSDGERQAYATGHRDARHAAAELAVAQDALVAQLVEALDHCCVWLDAAGIEKTMPVQQQARSALAAAKEQQ